MKYKKSRCCFFCEKVYDKQRNKPKYREVIGGKKYSHEDCALTWNISFMYNG